jgi:hypothetical protein
MNEVTSSTALEKACLSLLDSYPVLSWNLACLPWLGMSSLDTWPVSPWHLACLCLVSGMSSLIYFWLVTPGNFCFKFIFTLIEQTYNILYILHVEHHSCCPHCFPLGRGPHLGCRAEIRTRVCRTALHSCDFLVFFLSPLILACHSVKLGLSLFDTFGLSFLEAWPHSYKFQRWILFPPRTLNTKFPF